MLASVKRASAQLDAFLAVTHTGDKLDRPVLDYLAGAIADAADEASCEDDVTASAGVVAEMVAEYLFPPRAGGAITKEAKEMIQAVRAEQNVGSIAPVIPQQKDGFSNGTATAASQLAGLSLNAAALEWKPSAAAPAFTPSTSAPPVTGPSGVAEESDELNCDGYEWEEGFEEGYYSYDQDEDWAGVDETQALEVLSMHFPHYSPDVLCDILANNDGSLSMTLAILGQFEQELAAQQQVRATDETPPEPDAPPPKIDDEELFPSLGGTTAGSSSGASGGAFSWRKADDFAGALRKAAAATEARPDAYAQACSRSRAPPPGWSQTPSARREARAFNWVDTGDRKSVV